MPKKKKKVCIGIPCFKGVDYRILEDYMRFAFYLGRRYQEFDFLLAIKGKKEQFRARNGIIKAAIYEKCDYTLMLDDDHILDIAAERAPAANYEFLRVLLSHLEGHPDRGIVGAYYVQRSNMGLPVIMMEYPTGPSFMTYDDITGQLQKVDITGGGCMLLNMKIFEKIKKPWFKPEFEWGTDIQICRLAIKAGFSVWCDTSQRVGHVMLEREVVIPRRTEAELGQVPQTGGFLEAYKQDAMEFSGETFLELVSRAEQYYLNHVPPKDVLKHKEYYKNIGIDQLARNMLFHLRPGSVSAALTILGMFAAGTIGYGLDYYCGSAPIGFELAMRGHQVDFIDVEGGYSYEFVKWRAKKRKIRAGYKVVGPYDYILLLDAVEHMNPVTCETEIATLVDCLKPEGALVMNYLENKDFANAEHINMDKERIQKLLVSLGVRPITSHFWVKVKE